MVGTLTYANTGASPATVNPAEWKNFVDAHYTGPEQQRLNTLHTQQAAAHQMDASAGAQITPADAKWLSDIGIDPQSVNTARTQDPATQAMTGEHGYQAAQTKNISAAQLQEQFNRPAITDEQRNIAPKMTETARQATQTKNMSAAQLQEQFNKPAITDEQRNIAPKITATAHAAAQTAKQAENTAAQTAKQAENTTAANTPNVQAAAISPTRGQTQDRGGQRR